MPQPVNLDAAIPTSRAIEALARRIDRPVVLVGLMGVGKTSVGRKLAQLLRFDFVDADEAIEQAAQMSIPEMFERYGENGFRDGERRVIARLMTETRGARRVIATGGGAFVDPETRALVLGRAIAIWLDGDVDTLLERVSRKSNRPLLRQGDPRAILTRLKAEREPAYAEAPLRVESRSGPHQRTVLAVIQALEGFV